MSDREPVERQEVNLFDILCKGRWKGVLWIAEDILMIMTVIEMVMTMIMKTGMVRVTERVKA